jgi:hypothetical protein
MSSPIRMVIGHPYITRTWAYSFNIIRVWPEPWKIYGT